jgi:hypothetical protein
MISLSPADLDELDRFCLELDEELREPVITATALGLGFAQRHEISLRVPLGGLEPHKLIDAGATPAPATNLTGGPFLQRPSHRPTSLADSPVIPLCPWCAWERAANGHGSAARANQCVRVQSCARHSELGSGAGERGPGRNVNALGQSVAIEPAQTRCGSDAPPVACSPNPNAGVVPAYPGGRWKRC